jgi:membrane protease YdiL (CAAX protease family)
MLLFEILSFFLIPELTEFSPKFRTFPIRIIGHLFQLAATLSSIWIFTKFIDKVPFISIGFHLKNRFKDIVLGVFLGFVIMAIAYISLLSLNEIAFDSYVIQLKSILLSIIFFISVSVLEETLCRGYILGELLKTSNKYVALVISSAIFTALHSFNPNMGIIPVLNLFLAGILLGITYSYTKNLWFPIALHFSWNFFQGSIFGFEVSGQKLYSIIQQTRTEDNFINGGSFGFEGSLLATFLMIVTIFGIWKFYESKTS